MQSRREFLAGAALVMGAAVGGRVLAQGTQPAAEADKKIGWAVVGVGKLTQGQILPAFGNAKKSRLAGVVTGHAAEKAGQIVEKFKLDAKSVYGYDDFEKIAENPDIQVVYIVLPNGMHAEYTIRALKAGKHVLCEKPMANSAAECEQMIAAAKEAKRQLMVAYRVHFENYNKKLVEIVKNPGALGQLRLMETDHSFHIPAGAWRLNKKMAGGGALVDVGIYGLNTARFVTGEEPASVTAQLFENKEDPRFAEVEEGLVWTMKFPSGVLAVNTTSYNVKGTNHHRLMFSNGSIDMEPATGYHGVKWKASDASVPATLADIDQFAAQMDYLSECVTAGSDVAGHVSGEEGLRDQRLFDAIYEAARTGKTVAMNG